MLNKTFYLSIKAIPIKTCSYSGCNLPINSPYDEHRCLGHSALENKGCSIEDFYRIIREQKSHNRDYNFEGFIFIGEASVLLQNYPIDFQVKFSNCQFYPNIKKKEELQNYNTVVFNFTNIEIRKDLSISGCEFFGKISINNIKCASRFLFSDNICFNSLQIRNFQSNSVVEISRIKVYGDTEISGLNNPKSVMISNCLFRKEFEFSKFKLINSLIIVGCVFRSNMKFDTRAELGEMLQIKNSRIVGKTDFKGLKVDKEIEFSYVQFTQNVNFKHLTFNIDFNLTKTFFLNGVDFSDCHFNSLVSFTECELVDSKFYVSVFNHQVKFIKSKFLKSAEFNDVDFNDDVQFSNCGFYLNTETQITFEFSNTKFVQKTEFHECIIEGIAKFYNLRLSDRTLFLFRESKFTKMGLVIFQNINFFPFTTYFENNSKSETHNINAPLLIFRYCNLSNVFFTNNDLSYFSFFKTAFDESRLISNRWIDVSERFVKYEKPKRIFGYKRKKIIFEDIYFPILRKLEPNKYLEFSQLYQFQELNNYDEISNLYRRYKVALDNLKDYEQAGWFYFNEFEIKRRDLEGFDYFDNSKKFTLIKKFLKSKNKAKLTLYTLYKLLAGYGEKPLWSFLWFLSSFMLFTMLNMLSGVKLPNGTQINYNIALSSDCFNFMFNSHFWEHLGIVTKYTLYKIIPISYLSLTVKDISSIGFDGTIITFLNTIVLLFFLTFIAVGLKRIFRRF